MTARDELLARFCDEHAGPPNGTGLPLRCTAHGTFLLWVDPPLPQVTVACGPECAVADHCGAGLRRYAG